MPFAHDIIERRRARTPASIKFLTHEGEFLSRAELHTPLSIQSGTLKGFPNPPAMVRAEQSSAAPHANEAS